MHWLLVVIVLNTPVKTDLIFDSFTACMTAESEMRNQWADAINVMIKQKASKESLDFVTGQMTHGTCIPTK